MRLSTEKIYLLKCSKISAKSLFFEPLMLMHWMGYCDLELIVFKCFPNSLICLPELIYLDKKNNLFILFSFYFRSQIALIE